jgi:arabinose-5-phosphate isomerase
VAEFMTRSPTTIKPDLMAVEALKVFQARSFNEIVVVDPAGVPLGVVDSQDLPKLKIL